MKDWNSEKRFRSWGHYRFFISSKIQPCCTPQVVLASKLCLPPCPHAHILLSDIWHLFYAAIYVQKSKVPCTSQMTLYTCSAHKILTTFTTQICILSWSFPYFQDTYIPPLLFLNLSFSLYIITVTLAYQVRASIPEAKQRLEADRSLEHQMIAMSCLG